MTAADLDLVRELSAKADYLAVLAVARSNGSVHASLVKAGLLTDPWRGTEAVGVVVAGNARKLDHLRRTGRASAVFLDGWRWVTVEGQARVVGPEEVGDDGPPLPGVLRAIFVAAGGTHDDWDAFDRAMAEERRCAVFVAPDAIVSN